MSSSPSQRGNAAMAALAGPSGSSQPEDRRRHKRLSITVSARVLHAETSYRTEILDVSDGGMLLAPVRALSVAERQVIDIDSAALGQVRARVVCVSPMGIHVQIEPLPIAYQAAVQRLFDLTRAWAPN